MKDGNKDRRAPGENPRINDELAEYLDKKPEGLSEEDERACIPEPDEDSDLEDRNENRDDRIDEDEKFDEDEDWDDAWDEDEYRDRQEKDSGMRRHRARRRGADSDLF